MRTKWSQILVLCLLALVSLNAPVLMGQVDGGSVAGVVRDPSGAVVPKAGVTLTNLKTGTTQTTQTSSAGEFVFPVVPVGVYDVTITASGFEQSVQEGIVVSLSKTATVEAILKVGSATATVKVQATSAQLETETSQASTTIDEQTYDDLPIALTGGARSATVVADLMPGVSDNNGTSYGQSGAQGQEFSTSISGGQGWGGAESYDGIPMVTAAIVGDYRQQPVPVEALQEFSLVQNNFSAENGRTPGGILSFSTRSGTNAFHGQAYEYLRNTDLDADGYFATSPTITHQNEFGVNVGGPILIPHIYNGRDKLFFFAFYSGFRFSGGFAPSENTLPTMAERSGDFSALSVPIYDPTTTSCNPATGVCTRQQYQYNGILNVMPPNKISTAGKTFGQYLPQPTNSSLSNNYVSGGVNIVDENRWGGRIDYHVSDNNQIYGFFSLGPLDGQNYSTLFLPPISGYNSNIGDNYLSLVRLGWDHTFTPSLLLHLGAGFNRDTQNSVPPYNNIVTTYGIPNGLPVTPQMYFSPGITPYPSSGGGGGSTDAEYAYIENGFISWTHGKQQIKIGGEFGRFGSNSKNNDSIVDSLQPTETGLPGATFASGDPFASLMAGAFDKGAQSDNPYGTDSRLQYAIAYFQDDYKIHPRLTLNLGIRYEIPWSQYNLNDISSNFNPYYPNPGAGNIPGALIFQGHGLYRCQCKRFQSTRYVLWQPRVGLAYKLDNKTVLHAGFGLFVGVNSDYASSSADGYNASPTVTSVNAGITPAFYAQTGYPSFTPPPFIDPTYDNNGSINWYQQSGGLPSVISNYNLSMQRELPNGFMFDLGYVGNTAHHLGSQLINPNQIPISDIAKYGATTLTALLSSPLGQASGVPLPYAGFTGTVSQALRQFPQYQSIRVQRENIGHSAYNALQAKLQRHFTDGFSLLVSYTWAKLMTDSEDSLNGFNDEGHGPQDTFNRREDYVPSLLQSPSVAAISYVYDLPFGTNRKYLSHGFAGAVLGGWGLSGIQRYQAGTPLFQSQSTNTLPIGNAYLLPNFVPGVSEKGTWSGKFNAHYDFYINTAAFAPPPPNTFGNVPRNLPIRCFGYWDEDFSARKDFHLYERAALQFRADFFNAFNRALFGTLNGANTSNPGLTYNSATGQYAPINPGFGQIGSQANNPRTIQFALKFLF